MLRWIALAFVGVPLIELFLLTWISQHIGFSSTVLLVIVTGICGGALARREGLKVIRSWQRAMAEFRPPDEGVIDGLLVLVGGAFLITPGVLTDLLGVALLLPQTRRPVGAFVRARAMVHVEQVRPRSVPGPGEVVETQGQEVDESEAGKEGTLSS